MSKIINLRTFSDNRGNLTIIEKILPFEIKRVFYIYDVDDSIRGKHRHKETIQAAVCIKGSCKIFSTDGDIQFDYLLDSPEKCLIIEPQDWHYMYEFSQNAILLVLASTYFDINDYIFENY